MDVLGVNLATCSVIVTERRKGSLRELALSRRIARRVLPEEQGFSRTTHPSPTAHPKERGAAQGSEMSGLTGDGIKLGKVCFLLTGLF